MTTTLVQGIAQTRAFAVPAMRATQGAQVTGREFTGIAVPWGEVIDFGDVREEFAPGACIPDPNGVLLCWRHDDPIGRVPAFRDVDAGWEYDATIAETAQGLDAAALLRAEVPLRSSIRFIPEEWTTTHDDDDVEHIVITRATVSEVSLVPFPAYPSTPITGIRQAPTQPVQEDTMTTTAITPADLDEIRTQVQDLDRKVELTATAGTRATEPHPLAQFRSFGEYVKAVARGDEAALRAYTGLVTTDVIGTDTSLPDWAAAVIRIIEANTPTLTMFNHTRDLPAEGMTVDHGVIRFTGDDLKVAEQLLEGDDLVFGKLNLKLSSNPAKVHTIGGWTDMSRQTIERLPINVVDLMWRGFAIKYAQSLEALAAGTLTNLYNAQVTAAGTNVITGDWTTTNGLIDLLVELAARYSTSPYKIDALYVAKDVFKALALLPEERKALQFTGAPTDKVGTVSVSGLEGHVSNLTVKLWTGAPAGAFAAVDGQAIKVQESAGAPFRLQDENIVNLTKQFSVYGYAAAYSEFPEALVPIVKG